jgi:diadenylate cyclase
VPQGIEDFLQQPLAELAGVLQQFTFSSLVDVLLVALIFYGFLRLFQGTQAVALLRGILLVALVLGVASSRLTALSWLVRNSLSMFLVAIPVIFQPELRRALERLGRTAQMLSLGGRENVAERVIYEVVLATEDLAHERTGALIVLEGNTGLEEHIESGERTNAAVSARLLVTIFYPGTPLHDGAVIIRGDQIVAAGCVLPLTDRSLSDSSLGTRHRAALGITEQNDALAVVVSEETGIISAARNGRIERHLDSQQLRRILQGFYQPRRLFPNGSHP